MMLMAHPHPELQFTHLLPYGALIHDRGVQFVVFSRNATAMRLLLYDTGPGDGAGRDHVSSAVTPLVHELGKAAPDLLVISHGDLDHSGGLQSFRRRYPGTAILGSALGMEELVSACRSGQWWVWNGFSFDVLHPAEGLPYLRNNSSCVLGISNGAAGILLSGDIDRSVEQRLLLEGLGRYSLMLAPHHGSGSSSSPAIIERVAPSVALATASSRVPATSTS